MSAAAQQYCLRWNNHRTNLLTVFDELLQNEAFTDVTLVCEGGSPIKCHRMVLAACSPYFQNLFTDLPCKHPVVVLKDVKYSEIKAILEYMYRGEVNVAQDQLAALLRVAEALKVKGLVEEKRSEHQQQQLQQQLQHQQQQQQQQQQTPPPLPPLPPPTTTQYNMQPDQQMRHRSVEPMDQSPSAISTSTTSLPAPTVHSSSNNSPPHSTSGHFGGSSSRNHYAIYGKAPPSSSSSSMDRKMSMPIWAVPGIPMPPHHCSPITTASRSPHSHAIAVTAAAAMLNSCYNTSEADISSHMRNRKKMSSSSSASSSSGMPMTHRDTPILRTVLGQGQADSSQPVSLVCHPDSHDHQVNSNSNGVDELKSDNKQHIKNEPMEDAQSPFTDLSPNMDEEKFIKMGLQSSSPQRSYCNISSGIATYVPTQKPEWKRYKQYTRDDIMSAIEAVRNGTSALQAARNFGVPSRTLYDKVKKLGITTSRPFKRGSNGSSGSAFSFRHLSESEEHSLNNNSSSSALIEATSSFLQHALDGHRGPTGVGGDERDALAAMAAARAAVMSGHSSSPRSPSPGLANIGGGKPYMHQSGGSSSNSLTPSPPGGSDILHHAAHHLHQHHHSETNGSSERDREDMEEEDAEEEEEDYDDQQQVEDLSVGRRQQDTNLPSQLAQSEPAQESRVIMPPMNIASILKKEELLKESILEDMRREVKVDEVP